MDMQGSTDEYTVLSELQQYEWVDSSSSRFKRRIKHLGAETTLGDQQPDETQKMRAIC